VAAPDLTPEDLAPLVDAVTGELRTFIAEHAATLEQIDPGLQLLADGARAAVLAGGKRLRPSFAYWGWRSIARPGAPGERALVRAAASLELLHACALVHDDVMDASDTRRGQPAAHRQFAAIHSGQGWPGSARSFGTAGAILLGDLLLSWSEEMFSSAIGELPAARAAAASHEFDLMRTEVVAGQFLDVLAQTRGDFDPAEAVRVIEFKTSKYTVQRPLLVGARAAGADAAAVETLSRYGLALGEAFQLRDDLLGVFGDPAETGKPAGDDLREGKRTLLVALAAARADQAQAMFLRRAVGDRTLDDDGIERLRRLLIDTGAREAVERRIAARAAEAESAVAEAPITGEARRTLIQLAGAAAHRTF
jgi:geranylgeranyl diphosphate synthase, type I